MNSALASLRAFATPRARPERCELCYAPLPVEHEHLLDPGAERLRCACSACVSLFSEASSDQPRRIPSFARRIDSLDLDDATWRGLGVPVGLAFLRLREAARDVVASLPGRAGVVESLVPGPLWQALGERHPELSSLRPDVEALLVRRTPEHHDYFVASIDHCHRLAGLMRSERGPPSGPEPALLDRFFEELDALGVPDTQRSAS